MIEVLLRHVKTTYIIRYVFECNQAHFSHCLLEECKMLSAGLFSLVVS